MADNSTIEWTEATWNPVTGCTEVSPGCDNCYAKTFAERWRGTPGHPYEDGFDLTLRPERLDQPLHWTRPRRVFVNSMSDLFHDGVDDGFIADVFAVMARTPKHTYQLLTKRHGRMRSLLSGDLYDLMTRRLRDGDGQMPGRLSGRVRWPLPNVWVGVSVEDQKRADLRIPALLDTPAAVRWLSCEPLLGPVDLGAWMRSVDWPPCWDDHAPSTECGRCIRPDWVVVGGESGRGARPMHPDWARSLRDQCVRHDVPFFFKQHGEWWPIGPLYEQHDGDEAADDARLDAVMWEVEDRKRVVQLESTGHVAVGHQPTDPRTWLMARRGKKAAGRELEGRTWDEYPQTTEAVAA